MRSGQGEARMSDPEVSEVHQSEGEAEEGTPLLAEGGLSPESLGPACPVGTCAGRPRGCGG